MSLHVFAFRGWMDCKARSGVFLGPSVDVSMSMSFSLLASSAIAVPKLFSQSKRGQHLAVIGGNEEWSTTFHHNNSTRPFSPPSLHTDRDTHPSPPPPPQKFPSWPVPDLSGKYPVVGSGPGPSVHFPDHDPVFERPAKRVRITGKSSAVRRALVSGGGLPTLYRWKR